MLAVTKQKSSTAVTIIGIITLIFALGFVAVFLLIPAAVTLMTSMQKSTFTGGLFTSPFVGLDNYGRLLQQKALYTSLWWTVRFSAFGGVALFILALAFGYLTLACGRIRWLRHALCTLLLLPLAVPGELWAQAFYRLFAPQGINSILLISMWSAAKYIGLPVLLVAAACGHGKRKWTVPLLAGGAAALALFAAFGRLDYTFLRQFQLGGAGPLSLDLMTYRYGLINMQLGIGAVVSVLQWVICFVLLAAVAFPVAIMLKRLFPDGIAPDPAKLKDRLIGLIAPGCLLLLGAAALAIVAGVNGIGGDTASTYATYPLYITFAIFGAFVNTLVCFLLARPAASAGKAGKIVMTAVLLCLTAVGMSAIPLGEYLTARSIGMVGTWFAVAFSGIGSVWGVWPLVFAAKGMGISNGTEWFKRMWKPAIALFAVQLMLQMNNTVPSMLYENRASNLHPLFLAAQQMLQVGNTTNTALLLLAVMAIPVALLLIVRTALDEKDSLALFLPGK